MKDFCHLHLHSVFSILDGANKIDALAARVKELGMSSVALTDHGWMGGVIDFYRECKKNEVKPIIGVEAYITDDPDGLPKEERKKDNYHLVMLATNKEGYENLLYLVSNASLNNFYYKPRISKSVLMGRTQGIVATSACLGNECNRVSTWEPGSTCYSDPSGRAERSAKFYSQAFEGRYYLEIQDNDDEEKQQATYNRFIIDIGKRLGIPIVITSDAHYLKKEDKDTHDILMAMQTKQTLAEYLSPENDFKYGPWFYVRSGDEMWEAANKYSCPEAFENTLKIASMCNLELDLGKPKPPSYDISNVEDRSEFESWLANRHLEDESEHKPIGES
jgi:DNA polymerase-3 subunit alpha